jgi:hypothetical protein
MCWDLVWSFVLQEDDRRDHDGFRLTAAPECPGSAAGAGLSAQLTSTLSSPLLSSATMASLSKDESSPKILSLRANKAQAPISGEYHLMPDKKTNGKPLYKMLDKDWWFYYNTQDQWCIGGKEESKKFDTNCGWIYGEGSLPHKVATWHCHNGLHWHQDSTISVVNKDQEVDDDDDGHEGPEQPHYVWICHRADFTGDHYVNESIEREDIQGNSEAICNKIAEANDAKVKRREEFAPLLKSIEDLMPTVRFPL